MEGNYLTLVVMNFVIALCMLGTPLVVKSLVSSGLSSFSSSLVPVVGMTIASVYSKSARIAKLTKRNKEKDEVF